MSKFRFSHLVILALLAIPATALATLKGEPVQLRVVGPVPVLRPGEPVTIPFELVSAVPVQVSGLSVTSSSLAAPFAQEGATQFVAPGEPVSLSMQVLPTGKPDPIVVRWEVDGVAFERTIDLANRLESRLAERQALTLVEATPPPVPDARMLAEMDSVRRADTDKQAASTFISFSGRLVYTRPGSGSVAPVDMGAWGVRVSLMDQDTGPDDELASTYTGPDGEFFAMYYWEGQLGEGDPELYIQFETDHPWVVVQEGFWDIEYSWNTHARASSTADLHIGTYRPSDSSTHPALHIATNIARNHEWYREYPRDWWLDAVDVKWPDGSTGAWYDPLFGQIHIGTDREWKEDTQAHEYGHYFVDEYASFVSPDYCNGYCDSADCGHCQWCPEGTDEAMTEGWPNWIAHVQTSSYANTYGIAAVYTRNAESITTCGSSGLYENPEITEGFLGAVLQDIWDSGPGSDDADPNGFSGHRDWLELGDDEIMAVLDLDQPTTARGFLTAFANRYPQHRQRLWQTAMNSRWDLDQLPPNAPSGVASSSHPVGAGTANLNVSLSWTQPGPDDWSGVAGYSVLFSAFPSMPDVILETSATGSWLSGGVPAGTWYANVRTVDFAGRGSTTYATYGPFTVVTPTPVDIAPYTAPGWARPIVARATGDATATSVPNPTAQLPGNTALTYLNMSGRNQGQSEHFGFIGIRNRLFVDAVGVHTSGYVHPDAPGATFTHVNRSTTVRGGRHMVGSIYDGFNEWWESNEVNNYWSHAWIWSPLVLAPDTAVRRQKAPPVPTGSWSGVVDGSPLYYNCDGMRFTGSGWWNAVWVAADSDTNDYSIRLHAPSFSVNAGFDTVHGSADHPAGYLDGVIVNRRTTDSSGLLAWDVGVINDLDGTNDAQPQSSFVVRHVTSTTFAYGDTAAVAFPDSGYVVLKDIFVPAPGPVSVTVQADPADGPVYVTWLDRSYTYGALEGMSWTWPTGEIQLELTASAAGNYCVMLHRDPKDGRSGRTVTLGVGAPRSDIIMYTGVDWAGPLVPRTVSDGSPFGVSAPDTLPGSVAGTYVNACYANASSRSTDAALLAWDMRLDGETLATGNAVGLPAWNYYAVCNVGPFTVAGGRHLVDVRFDANDVEQEALETNNHWGEQWTWAPQMLGINGGFASTAPPDPVGGFEYFTGAEALFYNSLGFRADFASGTGWWGGVGVNPAAGSDADIRLHNPVAGARGAFGATLRSSSWGAGESDFVILRHTVARTVDASVVGGGDGVRGVFDISAGGAYPAVTPPFARSNEVIGAREVVHLHPLVLPAGSVRLRLTDAGDGVDWGLSLHDDILPAQGKADALAASWLEGAGQSEEITFNVAAPDTFVLAVWKRGSADRGREGRYTVSADLVVAAVPETVAPRISALAPPRPAPFSVSTRLAFELAASGEARLEVFDVRGARLRTLASGSLAAGRHEIEWHGEDDGGRRLPPGVYLLRLKAGGQSWHRKVVKVE
jgi:hypothetical protein